MNADQQQRLVELRGQGLSFDKIAETMNVSRRTLFYWNARLRSDIENERAAELERLEHECLAAPDDRVREYAAELQRILAELRTRDLRKVSTSRLYSLAATFRRQILHDTQPGHHTGPAYALTVDQPVPPSHDSSAVTPIHTPQTTPDLP